MSAPQQQLQSVSGPARGGEEIAADVPQASGMTARLPAGCHGRRGGVRDWEPDELFACGGGVGQTVRQDGKTQLLRLAGHRHWHSQKSHPHSRSSPAGRGEWGLWGPDSPK